jgi:hypothetical protein
MLQVSSKLASMARFFLTFLQSVVASPPSFPEKEQIQGTNKLPNSNNSQIQETQDLLKIPLLAEIQN